MAQIAATCLLFQLMLVSITARAMLRVIFKQPGHADASYHKALILIAIAIKNEFTKRKTKQNKNKNK